MSLYRSLIIAVPISLLLWCAIAFSLLSLLWVLSGCATPPPMRVPDVVEIEVPVPVMAPFDCECQCQPHKELEVTVDDRPGSWLDF